MLYILAVRQGKIWHVLDLNLLNVEKDYFYYRYLRLITS